MKLLPLSLLLVALLALTMPVAAEEPVSYAKQVRPFLARYCLECHTGERGKGGLNLESVAAVMAGGRNGPVVVPGKPDESRLVLVVEGKANPAMPPRKARQPKPTEVGVLRAWVAAGARDDSSSVTLTLPDIKPHGPVLAPIAALAYRPDGQLLVAGGHGEVLFLDPANGDVVGKVSRQKGKVTALAFSPDGKRLAVAAGEAGVLGEVRLYAGSPDAGAEVVLPAHKDLILDMAFSPDGKTLATCGYDRLVKLWDASTSQPRELLVLRDHSDAVYGLAFSPDGKLLASGSADRAVKVWEVATGKRLYTLSDPTDWVYAVAWSPDGKHLAAAGVDQNVRVWEVSAEGGRLVQAGYAHEGPVVRLAYSADGQTLYSIGEDRVLKVWDAMSLMERKVYARQPESILSLAVRPGGKQIALGRYDGALLLLDEAGGQVQSQPLPVQPKPPQLSKLSPTSGQRGQTVRVTFEGQHLDLSPELTTNIPGVTGKVLVETLKPQSVQVDVTLPPSTGAGAYQLGLKTSAGQAMLPFTVDLFAPVQESEPNDSPSTGQKVVLPATVVGVLQHAGDVDFYRLDVQAGQQLGVQAVTTAPGSKLEPVLELTDTTGRLLADSTSGILGYTFERAGTYALGLRDRDYRGGPEMTYRLQMGDVPVVTSVFPLGLQRGTEADVHLEGVFLGGAQSVPVKVPADAALGSRVTVPVTTPQGAPLGNPSLVVGEFPESVTTAGQPATVTVPGTANGRIPQPGATDTWHFTAHKGQTLILEVNARRLGSPLDSYIEILDSKGQPLPRATLRCLSRTYTTFRDHDSATAGIRIESWNDLAINDYLYVGSELMRIKALPRNPDDDCQFFSTAGQRIGFLDTTPEHHSLGTPMYKVAIHPPGTSFPPNGLPVITLFYRNDDGGPGYGKDSRLFFEPPADGEYQVRIGDSRGQGGPTYAYRLTVRSPRPSFQVSFSPTAPAVWKGGALPVTVSCDRTDGFDGPIAVRLENVPPGFSAPATSIPAGENSTAFALSAEATATTPGKVAPLKLVARALIDGQEVVREVNGGVPTVVEPGDLATTTEQSEVTVRPGQEVTLTVKVERRNGFTGRVPVEVRGLPHGVHVLDVGLNGILITERESSRVMVIRCEPWVTPTEQPFVVLARREGKNTEHAARSVLLRIVK